jgi:hypothetical protein
MISTLLTIGLSLSLTYASSIPSNFKRGDGILRLPVTATNITDSGGYDKRQISEATINTRSGTLYLVDCKCYPTFCLTPVTNCVLVNIGTPAQPVSVILDTGSSFTWVNPQCSTSGSADNEALCNSLPRYDQSKSSSAEDLFLVGTLTYGKGSVSLHFYNEKFSLGGMFHS